MKPKIDVIGASGAVGQELLRCLEKSPLVPVNLRLFASARSAGRSLNFAGQDKVIEVFDELAYFAEDHPADLVFLVAGGERSRKWARRMVARGQVVIDNSSAFRLESDVPLVIPEINAQSLPDFAKSNAGGGSISGLIANPNCSTIVALMALAPLHRCFGLRSLMASTYQAVSGAGQAGLDELESQTRRILGPHMKPDLAENLQEDGSETTFGRQIAFNVIPWIGAAGDGPDTDEELKMRHESRKILELPDLEVCCTAVRVPVMRAHAVSMVATFERPTDLERAEEALQTAKGVQYQPIVDADLVWTPIDADGRDEVLVTRLRELSGAEPRLALFAIGDQLRKGAALNAVQIAELAFPS